MDQIFPLLGTEELLLAALVGIAAGFVKGVVGFAMPLVFISGLTLFMPPDLALAGLVLPTLATNGFQALRQGLVPAWRSTQRFGVFLLCGGVMLILAAQFVRVLSDRSMLLIIGGPVTFFALLMLSGYKFRLSGQNRLVEALVGGFAGTLGGLSGIWGPPTVAYLTAINTPKHDQMRVQGVIYGLGSAALVAAHIGSGVLRAETWTFSAAMIVPGVLGMWIGSMVMDRIDQITFRRATLFILLIVGANLLRRGLAG